MNSNTPQSDLISKALFNGGDHYVYALLDGASIGNIRKNLLINKADYFCLYRGELDPELAQMAPYVVVLEEESATFEWVVKGFGSHWGIYIVTTMNMQETRKHLRKFTMVWSPEGKPLYFRYYDPRVLSVYLPTCNEEEIKTVFGSVMAFFAEKDDGSGLTRFTQSGGKLGVQEYLLPVNN